MPGWGGVWSCFTRAGGEAITSGARAPGGRDKGRLRTMTRDATDFIRRFLQLSAIVSNRDRIRIDLRQRQGCAARLET